VAFVQGPERYLSDMGATFSCVVHPDQPAIIDARHRAFVNYEVYYFGSDEALLAFVAEPWKYTGRVTDPVTRERFVPTADTPRRSFGGRLMYLMTEENAAMFDRDPATYATPHPTMQVKS
jgi:YHS domain-containing protein